MSFEQREILARARRYFPVLACLALVSCSESATGPGPSTGDVRVNMFAQTDGVSASVAASKVGGSAMDVQSIDIDRVAVVFGGVKLETAGVDQTVDWVMEESRVVELDLAGGPTAAADYDVAPGTYKEVEVSIDKLEPGNPAEDPLIAQYPELSNASVIVEGTVVRGDGSSAPFGWATDLDRDLEIALTPFLTVADPPPETPAESTVIAIVIRVGDWFDDGAGGLLDPTDDANRSAIESNAGDSILAFEDPDEDGEDDG